MPYLHELGLPDELFEEEERGHELVRFWICDGRDHVVLKVGLFDNDKEPAVWGSVAADIARHAVNAMMQDDPARDAAALYAEIERAFAARLKAQTNLEGQLKSDLQ